MPNVAVVLGEKPGTAAKKPAKVGIAHPPRICRYASWEMAFARQLVLWSAG